MAESPFTFYRGSAAVMAADLATAPTTGIAVQACGDAHCLNFGIYASPERQLVFDVNDFDETHPAPWELDLKRLVASAWLDARSRNWSEERAAEATAVTAAAYRDTLADTADLTTLESHYAMLDEDRFFSEHHDPDVVKYTRKFLRKARRRTHDQAVEKLTEVVDGSVRFRQDPPLLARLSNVEAEEFRESFDRYRETLRDDRRRILERFAVLDVARKVVGVGSVGLRAFVVLCQGSGGLDDTVILQVKEATGSVLSPRWGNSIHPHEGERVVAGQRLMQAVSDPFLGWVQVGERDYYVRQLRDNKGPSSGSGKFPIACVELAVCGATLARAHGRSVDPAILAGYVGKGDVLIEALVEFAKTYADQAEADHAHLVNAIARGRIPAELDL